MADEGAFAQNMSPEEQATLDLVTQLVATRDVHPLIARLRNGDVAPEGARAALRVLAEFDLDLMLQITVDGLMRTNPAPTRQPRRPVRGD